MVDKTDNISSPAQPRPGSMETRIGNHILSIERHDQGGIIRLTGPEGAHPLEIEIVAGRPVLKIGTGLDVAIRGTMSIEADSIAMHVRDNFSLQSGGALSVRAGGDLYCEAEAHELTARLGDVRVKANDDVLLLGERVRVNC